MLLFYILSDSAISIDILAILLFKNDNKIVECFESERVRLLNVLHVVRVMKHGYVALIFGFAALNPRINPLFISPLLNGTSLQRVG